MLASPTLQALGLALGPTSLAGQHLQNKLDPADALTEGRFEEGA